MSSPELDLNVIRSHINEIIAASNLESTSVRSILVELENRFGPLIGNENEESIKDLIDDLLLEKVALEEDAQLAGKLQAEEEHTRKRTRQPRTKTLKIAPVPKKRQKTAATGFNKPMILSPALSDLFGGSQQLSRPQVVKKIWEYVKMNKLQDESNKKFIICDEKLEAIFKRKRLDCFQMNKYLSSHLSTTDEVVKLEEVEPPANTVGTENQHYTIHDELPIPATLRQIVPELESPCKYSAILDSSLLYVRNQELFDPKNPTSIQVDEKIRDALSLSIESRVTLFDFVERIRALVLGNKS